MHAITLLKEDSKPVCVCICVSCRKIRRIKFEYKKTIATDNKKHGMMVMEITVITKATDLLF